MSWPTGKVADIATVISGYAFKSEWFGRGTAKIIRIGNLQNNKITDDDIATFDSEIHTVSSQFKIASGDILMALSGATVGKTAIAEQKDAGSYLNQRVAIVRGKTIENSAYLKYVFSGPLLQNLLMNAGGAAQPNLSPKSLAELQIPLPPLAEQKRIAAILDKADEIRRKREQTIAKLDQLAQSIFVEMFGDAITGNEKMPSVGFENITTRITYGFTSPMRHIENGIPILTAKNVKNGFLDLENVHFADQNQFDALTEKSKPKKGDILITKDGTIGRTALVDTDDTLCINQSVALVQLNKQVVEPQFVVGYLTNNTTQSVMKSMGKGNALAHLQITELAKLPIPLPSLDIQKEYSQRIKQIHKIKELKEIALAKQNQLFASLQHQAFTTGFNA